MKKPFNVLSKTTMAAFLATSALVPAAVAHAEESVNIEEIIVAHEGKIYSVSFEDFNEMMDEDASFEILQVKFGGKYYSFEDFSSAIDETTSLTETKNLLEEYEYDFSEEYPVDGVVENNGQGPEFKDETPEEKVNETFFYNLAA